MLIKAVDVHLPMDTARVASNDTHCNLAVHLGVHLMLATKDAQNGGDKGFWAA